MLLQKNNYYVVSGRGTEDGPLEHIMVYYFGKDTDFKHKFKVVAYLSEVDEGGPELGEDISCSDEDMEEMKEHNIRFRQPTQTELILYGSTAET